MYSACESEPLKIKATCTHQTNTKSYRSGQPAEQLNRPGPQSTTSRRPASLVLPFPRLLPLQVHADFGDGSLSAVFIHPCGSFIAFFLYYSLVTAFVRSTSQQATSTDQRISLQTQSEDVMPSRKDPLMWGATFWRSTRSPNLRMCERLAKSMRKPGRTRKSSRSALNRPLQSHAACKPASTRFPSLPQF